MHGAGEPTGSRPRTRHQVRPFTEPRTDGPVQKPCRLANRSTHFRPTHARADGGRGLPVRPARYLARPDERLQNAHGLPRLFVGASPTPKRQARKETTAGAWRWTLSLLELPGTPQTPGRRLPSRTEAATLRIPRSGDILGFAWSPCALASSPTQHAMGRAGLTQCSHHALVLGLR